MEDAIFPANTMLDSPADPFMDLDYMDELLLEGCWLETTDGSEIFHQSPFFSTPVFDPISMGPSLEVINGEASCIPTPKNTQEERQESFCNKNPSISQSQGQNPVKVSHSMDLSSQYENHFNGDSELTRRCWIAPRTNLGRTSSVMDRLIRALGCIKSSTRDKDVLIQVWVPIDRGSKRVLTTNDQPFSLDLNCPRLARYRDISVHYQFSAEKDSQETLGLPGRVFMFKVPEWTPDVQLFGSDEYPRVSHAQHYNVRGTLAVPVFEQGSRSCLGVIEVVTTTRKIHYRPELENVCKALEAVDLRSSEVSSTQNVKEASDRSYQAALPEIIEVLRLACVTHRLPLAQTWVPCIQQGKEGSRHSNENFIHCVSTVDSACFIGDPSIRQFHEACSEHHLLKGQGVAGRAFATNQPCFSTDITSFSKTEYPLAHHASMFGLHAAVAIRLRSIHTGTADFVLEFFLDMDCRDLDEQTKMLNSLSIIIQKASRSLRVISDIELQEEMQKMKHSEKVIQEASLLTGHGVELQVCDNVIPLFQKGEKKERLNEKSSEFRQHHPSISRANVAFDGKCSTAEGSSHYGSQTGEKKRSKTEKNITLEILRQYFAGSLKDAAKCIGVCPTTLKRICRQHGIKRWPSRKIKKVGHSLQKIQCVINSVQGTSGVLQIESFYSNFPELASPNLSGTSPFSNHKSSDTSNPTQRQLEQAAASKSPSSFCSQNSSSSQCCSSGTQSLTCTLGTADDEDLVVTEDIDHGTLKRVRSEAELHVSGDGPKQFPRSQSHKSFGEQPKSESLSCMPKISIEKSQEENFKRVKVTYGEEKIRFRMQNNWGYQDLLHEIMKRFGIEDISGFRLKYLDDDSEWVLLTCDADLEECIDACQASQSHTIKISLLRDIQPHLGSSLCSNNLF